MIIRFKEQDLTVRENDKGLYNLNDLHRAAGLPGKLNDLVRHLSEKAIRRFDVSTVKGGKAENQGTWANKRGVYWFASKVDEDFEDAVYSAFEAAASGEGNKAVDIATSVVIDPKLIEKEKRLREALTSIIKERMPNDKYAYSNFNRLLSKCFSGYTPKELTDARMSAFNYAVHLGHTDGVGAYLAALRMAVQGIGIGLDYHTVAAMLDVETSKNKTLLVK